MKNSEPATTLPIILYGIDQHQKFRAALFPSSQADIATRAAARMNLNTAEVRTKELESLAAELPTAKIYEAGKGGIPYVQKSVYGKIVALAGPGKIENAIVPANDNQKPTNGKSKPAKTASSSQPQQAVKAKTGSLPRDWKDVRVGHMVIAQASKKDGWWEAIVVSINRDVLTLRWRDYPKYPVLSRHRSTVALLKPDMN